MPSVTILINRKLNAMTSFFYSSIKNKEQKKKWVEKKNLLLLGVRAFFNPTWKVIHSDKND